MSQSETRIVQLGRLVNRIVMSSTTGRDDNDIVARLRCSSVTCLSSRVNYFRIQRLVIVRPMSVSRFCLADIEHLMRLSIILHYKSCIDVDETDESVCNIWEVVSISVFMEFC